MAFIQTSIIDGKALSNEIKLAQAEQVEILRQKTNPRLDIILCGDNPASILYVTNKQKYCESIGVEFHLHKVAITQEDLTEKILELNSNSEVKAFFVQLPLPKELKEKSPEIIDLIDPHKDVDCLTSTNLGKILTGDTFLLPGTVRGIIQLIEKTNIVLKGSNVVVINNSIIIGKPLAMYLSNAGATVTICHEFTKDLSIHTKNADIIITATGVPSLIKMVMVPETSVIIDAGIAVVDGKTLGDADIELRSYVKAITPVPGGVGPMTITSVVQNLIDLYEKHVTDK